MSSDFKSEWRRSWVIVLSACVCYGLILGLSRQTGIILALIITNFNVSRTEASTIIIVKRLIEFATAILVSKLSAHCMCSSLICIGGTLISLGLLLTFLASQLWQIVISFGVIMGIGNTFVISTIILALGKSFDKQKSLAFSIYFAVSGLGGLATPLFFEKLLQNFGLKGTFFVYSALMLHIIPFGLLIQPPSTKPSKLDKNKEECKPLAKKEDNDDLNINSTPNVQKPTRSHRIYTTICVDFSIFKDKKFLILFFSRVLTMMTVLNLMQFIPDYVTNLDINVTNTDIAFMLPFMSAGDILARLSIGLVFKRLPCHLKFTFASWAIISGSVAILFQIFRSYAGVFICHVIAGMALGICSVLPHVIESDLFGREKAAASHGITQFVIGPLGILMTLAVSYFRDVTGSYTIGLSMLGVSGILGGLIWFLDPLLDLCS